MRHLLVLLPLLLASCVSSRFSITSTTEAGKASCIEVEGRRPRVEVSNLGPGEVRLRILSGDEPIEQVLGVASTMRTLRGPITIWIEPTSAEGAAWSVVASGAEGLDMDLVVEGYTPGLE